jgi:hypothetical protein
MRPAFRERNARYGFQFAPPQELSRAVTSRIVGEGKKTWHMIVADYVFGHSARRREQIHHGCGGKVLGQTCTPQLERHGSALLTAQGSGADVIGLAMPARSRDHGEAGRTVRARQQARSDDGLREQHRGTHSRGIQGHAHGGLDLWD